MSPNNCLKCKHKWTERVRWSCDCANLTYGLLNFSEVNPVVFIRDTCPILDRIRAGNTDGALTSICPVFLSLIAG